MTGYELQDYQSRRNTDFNAALVARNVSFVEGSRTLVNRDGTKVEERFKVHYKNKKKMGSLAAIFGWSIVIFFVCVGMWAIGPDNEDFRKGVGAAGLGLFFVIWALVVAAEEAEDSGAH